MLRHFFLIVFLFIYTTLIADNNNFATVKFVIGSVELQKSQQLDWARIQLDSKISEGDRIKTAAQSRVELDMPDGSVLKINENSVFDIKEIKTPQSDGEDKMSFTLWAGNLWAGFKKIFSDSQERTIDSPSAVVAIRGTTIEMDVDIQQKTVVRVLEGSVNVKSKDTDDEVTVNTNQETVVEKGKAPTDPQGMLPDEGEDTGDADFPFRLNIRKFVFTDPGVLRAGIPVNGRIPAGATLSVNNVPVPVKPDGTFITRLRVVEGINELNIQASKDDRTLNRKVKVFVNTRKPQIKLATPLISEFSNRRDYSLSGAIFDLTPNDKIKVTLNREEVAEVEGRASFNRTIILKEGSNKIVVVATDRSGNSKEYVQELFLDTVKPILTITEPANAISNILRPPLGSPNQVSRQIQQTIRGVVIDPEPSSGIKRIVVNGKDVKPNSDGSFETTIPLSRGLNRLNFVVEDLAGNILRDNTRKIRMP